MVDVDRVLEIMSSHGLLRLNRPMGDWYSVYCPFHKNGEERRPSCGVSRVDSYQGGISYRRGTFHCFTCGTVKSLVSAVGDILKNKGIQESGSDWLIKNVPGYEAEADFDYLIPEDLMTEITSNYNQKILQNLNKKEDEFVSEEELQSYRYTVPYMYERRLTDEIIEEYDVGVDMNWIPPGRKRPVPCITFPVHDENGNTVFICRRSIEGKLYHYPKGSVKCIYGVDKIPADCKSLVICESAINALTSVSYGYPAIALLGTGTVDQMKYIQRLGIPEYVICTDGDDAGRRCANKLKRTLSSVAVVWTIDMPEGKDLNDLDKDEFVKLYEERQ